MVCDNSDDLNGEAVTFYFMVVEGGKSIGSASWNPTSVGGTGFDMIGPEPPGNITIGRRREPAHHRGSRT
jgi:hypothetical protein